MAFNRLIFLKLTILLVLLSAASSWATLGDVAIFKQDGPDVGWISKEDANIQRAIVFDNLKNDVPSVDEVVYKTDAEIGPWAEERIDDGVPDIIIIFGWFPTTLYAPGNSQVNGSIAERFLYGGNIILNCGDYVFFVTEGDPNGENALKNIININADMWGNYPNSGPKITPTNLGKEHTPSLVSFTSERPFRNEQIVFPWRVEAAFGSDGATLFDPGIIKLHNSSGRVGICMQEPQNGDLPRGQVLIEMIDFISQQADVVNMSSEQTPTVGPAPNYSQIYVDAVNGVNAVTGRGSADKPYKTITFALLMSERNQLPDPWQVLIRPGTYNADPLKPQLERERFPIQLRNNMIISGTTTAAACIIDAHHLDSSTVPILNGTNAGGVTIQNLTIRNMSRTESAGGIDLWDHTNEITKPNQILSCVIQNNHPNGVATNVPLVLANNTISNSSYHGVWSNTSVSATHNTFTDNATTGDRDFWRAVLHIEGESSGDITNNTFQNNGRQNRTRSCVSVTSTLNATISNNTFTDNKGTGINLRSFHGDITNNTFTNNEWQGVDIQVSITGNITHNTFRNNSGTGLRVSVHEKGMTGNITHNTFAENKRGGIRVTGWAETSVTGNIAYNKFIGNSSEFDSGGGFFIERSLSGSITHNLFIGNSAAGSGGFEILENSTNTVEVSNNIFVNNKASGPSRHHLYRGTISDAVLTRQAAHFFNNLFLTESEKLVTDTSDTSVVESEGGTVWVNQPGCRFHNNIFSGGHTAIFIKDNHDLPITHNIFHNNILNTFVNQAGNAFGIELEIWELFATNASDNIVAKTLLIESSEDRDYRLQNPELVIDAGTNEFTPVDDYNGDARPVGGTVDIGPYEYPEETEGVTLAEAPAWDVNEDGIVNILDLVLIARFFGLSDFRANPRVDVNGDGVINILDLVLVASHFGEFTGAAAPSGTPTPADIDLGTVQAWIQQAQVADDGSIVFREGIANLKQLLAVSTPQKTALLVNYPNPFNPETWIPYQLAKPADVTLRIYAADGKLVRTFALGHQAVGKYYQRSRAAYWDGKNETGESVASGVYFYTLTAGDFSATRKMLILK